MRVGVTIQEFMVGWIFFPCTCLSHFTPGKALGFQHALHETVVVNFGLANVLLLKLKHLCKAKYYIKMNIGLYIAPFGWSSLITCPPNIQLYVKLVTHEMIFIYSVYFEIDQHNIFWTCSTCSIFLCRQSTDILMQRCDWSIALLKLSDDKNRPVLSKLERQLFQVVSLSYYTTSKHCYHLIPNKVVECITTYWLT